MIQTPILSPKPRTSKPFDVSESSQVPRVDPTRPYSLILVLDFDGTVTKKDTMHILADAGYNRQRLSRAGEQPAPWTEMVDAYMADFKAHSDSYSFEVSRRFNINNELAWLGSLSSVERASLDRVLQAGIFDNIDVADIERTAGDAIADGSVQIRDGLNDLLAYVEAYNTALPRKKRPGRSVRVVSVNWSGYFIRQVMRFGLEKACDADERGPGKWSGIPIHANELPSLVEAGVDLGRLTKSNQQGSGGQSIGQGTDSTGTSMNRHDTSERRNSEQAMDLDQADEDRSTTSGSGLETPPDPALGVLKRPSSIVTGADKANTFRAVYQGTRMRNHDNHGQPIANSIFLYVGDSTTDLECLLEADIGVCVRDDPMSSGQKELADTCGRVGIRVVHVSDADMFEPDKADLHKPHLFWARDFLEIKNWLERNKHCLEKLPAKLQGDWARTTRLSADLPLGALMNS